MHSTTNEMGISLFHYENGWHFERQGETDVTGVYEKIHKLYEEKKLGIHELCLLRILSEYGCLNKYTITRALNELGYIPPKLRKTDYSNLLVNLRREGLIECYRLAGRGEDSRTLYVYALSPAAVRLLSEQEQREGSPCDMSDAVNVLERLSLNQYAVSVRAVRKGRCFQPFWLEGNNKKMLLPFGMKGANMTLLIYVCPKRKEGQDFLIRDMVYLLNTLEEKEDVAIILLGEDLQHIRMVAKELLSYQSLHELPVYYAMEAAYDKDPFQWLYVPDVVEEKLRFYKVDITPFL